MLVEEQHMSYKFITLLIMPVLLIGMGGAQALPDAPSVALGAFPPSNATAMSTSYVTPSAGRKPLVDPAVADGSYWGSTFALVSSTIVNVEITARCSEEHTCLTWIANGPSRIDLYAYTLPTDAALSYLSYKLKSKTRFWMLPDALFTAANLFSAGRSYDRLQVGVTLVKQPSPAFVHRVMIPLRFPNWRNGALSKYGAR